MKKGWTTVFKRFRVQLYISIFINLDILLYFVAYSTSSRALSVKGVRKHMGTRVGMVEYKYSHYYVRLEEGKPPADYNSLYSETYEARAKEYIEQLRKREIYLSI